MFNLSCDFEALAKKLQIENVEFTHKPFTLWWSPEVDVGRAKHIILLDYLKKNAKGKRILEIGLAWGGRHFVGSKVLDLYDKRTDQVDYRLDACNINGIPDNSFDFIMCNSVLEHIPKFWLAAAEIQRVLDLGGLVWVGVPWVWTYHPGTPMKTGEYMNFGGDYWRMNHAAMIFLFDRCQKVAVWYDPPGRRDHPQAGWGVTFVGKKVR